MTSALNVDCRSKISKMFMDGNWTDFHILLVSLLAIIQLEMVKIMEKPSTHQSSPYTLWSEVWWTSDSLDADTLGLPAPEDMDLDCWQPHCKFNYFPFLIGLFTPQKCANAPESRLFLWSNCSFHFHFSLINCMVLQRPMWNVHQSLSRWQAYHIFLDYYTVYTDECTKKEIIVRLQNTDKSCDLPFSESTRFEKSISLGE